MPTTWTRVTAPATTWFQVTPSSMKLKSGHTLLTTRSEEETLVDANKPYDYQTSVMKFKFLTPLSGDHIWTIGEFSNSVLQMRATNSSGTQYMIEKYVSSYSDGIQQFDITVPAMTENELWTYELSIQSADGVNRAKSRKLCFVISTESGGWIRVTAPNTVWVRETA